MLVRFHKKFLADIGNISDASIKKEIEKIIIDLEQAKSLREIKQVKKLKALKTLFV